MLPKNVKTGKSYVVIVLSVLLIPLLGGCTAGPISYQDASEIRNTISDLEQRLGEVESTLAFVTSEADLSEEFDDVLGQSMDKVQNVASTLGSLKEKLGTDTQQQQPGELPAQPQQF